MNGDFRRIALLICSAFAFAAGGIWFATAREKQRNHEIGLRGPPPIGIYDSGSIRLCMVPTESTTVTCWGNKTSSGYTPNTWSTVAAKEQYCCPKGREAAFTVPNSIMGYYVGRDGKDEVLPFEEFPSGAHGGRR